MIWYDTLFHKILSSQREKHSRRTVRWLQSWGVWPSTPKIGLALIFFFTKPIEERSMRQKKSSPSSTSPCATLRDAYNNCFNRYTFHFYILHYSFAFLLHYLPNVAFFLGRWYAEKFMKGHWDKEECLDEWQKYRACLSVWSIISMLSSFQLCVILCI